MIIVDVAQLDKAVERYFPHIGSIPSYSNFLFISDNPIIKKEVNNYSLIHTQFRNCFSQKLKN